MTDRPQDRIGNDRTRRRDPEGPAAADPGGPGPRSGARRPQRVAETNALVEERRPEPSGWTPYDTEPAWPRDQAPPDTDPSPEEAAAAGRPRRVTALVLAAVIAAAAIATVAYAVGLAAGADTRGLEVPVVRGQDLATANNVMQQRGLQTVLAPPVFDDQIGVNDVVGTNPPAGTTVRAGDVITIEFSSGPEPVPVPPLAGQPEDGARNGLSQVGLTPGLRVAEASAETPAGSVVRTEPEVGTDVAPGTPITLVVSSGPPPVVLPRVIGLTESEAEEQLTEQGLEVEIETQPAASAAEQGRVVDQSPVPGTVADPGGTVTLTVGSG